jgi:hypothetical protein
MVDTGVLSPPAFARCVFTRHRSFKSHAVEYDVSSARVRLLPPLPFDVPSLLKTLRRARGQRSDCDAVAVNILKNFENKASHLL